MPRCLYIGTYLLTSQTAPNEKIDFFCPLSFAHAREYKTPNFPRHFWCTFDAKLWRQPPHRIRDVTGRSWSLADTIWKGYSNPYWTRYCVPLRSILPANAYPHHHKIFHMHERNFHSSRTRRIQFGNLSLRTIESETTLNFERFWVWTKIIICSLKIVWNSETFPDSIPRCEIIFFVFDNNVSPERHIIIDHSTNCPRDGQASLRCLERDCCLIKNPLQNHFKTYISICRFIQSFVWGIMSLSFNKNAKWITPLSYVALSSLFNRVS